MEGAIDKVNRECEKEKKSSRWQGYSSVINDVDGVEDGNILMMLTLLSMMMILMISMMDVSIVDSVGGTGSKYMGQS